MNKFASLVRIAALLCPLAGQAAPMDALLTADDFHRAGEFRAEITYDGMNDRLDIFRVRAQDAAFAGSNVGDYSGGHVKVGYAVSDRLWIDGSFWQRRVTYQSDQAAFGSWQLAGQYRLLGQAESAGHLALRISAWGNGADSLTKSSPTSVGGRTVTHIIIKAPADQQQQIDLIGTLRTTDRSSVSTFLSVGRGEVATGNMTANYTAANGCNYLLSFSVAGTNGRRTDPCTSTGPILDAFSDTQNNVSSLSYSANYLQVGGMAQWGNENWRVRGGYQFQSLKRATVDAQINAAGGTPYETNHVVIGEVSRKVAAHAAVVLRGQVMSNQLLGEVPFGYNAFTANKFGRRYGLVSIGFIFSF